MATVRGIRAVMGGVALLLVPLLAGACAGGDVPAAPADDAELVLGQALWTANCAQCHAPDGGGALGNKLNDGVLLERFPDADEQTALLVEGKGQMPSFADKLSDAELDAVVRYTREVLAAG